LNDLRIPAAATLSEWSTPPDHAPPIWFQNRGRAFERIINGLLSREALDPRTSFRPVGEEVDGSFILRDRVYLLEAKWRREPMPASDLYAFKGKVDGKLVGTIGVFISMSGYSKDAIDALKAGKEINLVLFSGEDFRMVERGGISFSAAIFKKLRYAAEEGQPYLPLAPDEFAEPQEPTSPDMPSVVPLWDIVVEGANDEIGLRRLVERMAPDRSPSIRIWAAGGSLNVPSLVRNLLQTGHGNVAAILDKDAAARSVAEQLEQDLRGHGGHLIFVSPNMEDWLESCCSKDYILAAPPTSIRAKAMRRFSGNSNLWEVLDSNIEFARWAQIALGVTADQFRPGSGSSAS